MLNKHPILILLFVMLTSLAFAVATANVEHVIYNAGDEVQEVAIVGSRVHFKVIVSPDGSTIDAVKIKSDDILGAGVFIDLTLTDPNTYEGDYPVVAGDVNKPLAGEVYQAFVYIDGLVAPVNTTNEYLLKIDNEIPVITGGTSTWIESNPVGKPVFGIGDQMKFSFNRNFSDPTKDVTSVKLDLTLIGGPAEVVATRAGNTFTATYTLLENGITAGYTPEIIIPITMTDQNGNVSATSASNVISGDLTNNPYPADSKKPIFTNISDLQDLGQFRFSPGNDMFGNWDTEPNTISAKIEIPGFGLLGNTSTFVLLVQNENTNTNVGNIYFDHDGANVTITGNVVTFVWDGKVDGSVLGDAVYGLTLDKLIDAAGNVTTLTSLPPVLTPIITNGQSELNALDFVVDNQAPLFEKLGGTTDELKIKDSVSKDERYTINRVIDESTNVPGEENSWGAEDTLISTDEVYFAFSVKRDFANDLEPARKETVKYWIEVASVTTPAFKKYFYPTASQLGENAITPTVKTDVSFVETQAYAIVNSDGSFAWSPSAMDYVAGDYTVTAYIQDNAGNIKTSVKTVELVNTFSGYVPPIIPPDSTTPSEITSYEITSRHEGGAAQLPALTGFVPNFYVTSYFPSALGGAMYYNTGTNSIDIVVEVSNRINAQKVVFTRINPVLPDEFNAELSSFDANNSVTLSIPVSAFDETAVGTFTYGKATSSIKIEVITRDIEDGPFNLTATVVGNKSFKIIRPEQPVWPEIASGGVTVVPHCISPGNPSWAYDAVTNPANEAGMLHNGIDRPANEISFSIADASVNYAWNLRVYDPDNPTKVKSINGNRAANSGIFNETLDFANLSNANTNIVGVTESKLLNIELKVTPTAYSDTGYIAPDTAKSLADTRVDNENPVILGTDGNNYLPGLNADGNTLFLANGINSFNFDIETNEHLVENGWSAVVYDEDTYQVVPGAVVNVTAVGSGDMVLCPNSSSESYKNFNITAEIPAFADGILENVNYTLILRTPNDFGGNPGRYNNPPFPYGADAWYQDSSEAFVHFIVLREAPEIVGTSGSFNYINDANINVLDKAATAGNFEFKINVAGYPGFTPTQRAVTGNPFSVDFTNFTGVTIDTGYPEVNLLGSNDYEIIYKGSYTGVVAGIDHSDVIPIPVELSLDFTAGDVAVHNLNFIYNEVVYDNQGPIFTDNVVPNTVDEGTTLILEYLIEDAIAGVQADKVTMVCSDTNLTYDTIGTSLPGNIYQWLITIPNNYPTNTLTFDFVAQDNLDNERTHSHIVDIISEPTVTNVVVLNNSPEHQDIIKDGDVVNVTFDLTDSERIDAVTITLNDTQVFSVTSYGDGTNTYTIDPFNASNYSQYDVVSATVKIDHAYNYLDDDSSAESNPALVTPFVDENQVVISDLKFFENGVEKTDNVFSAETHDDFYVEATFVAYDGHISASGLLLNYAGVVAGTPTEENVVVGIIPVTGFLRNTYTYRWEKSDFDYAKFVDPANIIGYVDLNFNLEITSDYAFFTEYDEDARAIQDIPTISNVEIFNVTAPNQLADHGNHIDIIQNHNKVKVTFELTDASRVLEAIIELNNSTTKTITSGLVDGVNTAIIDDFGTGNPEYVTLKVDELKIIHTNEDSVFESIDASTNTLVPFVDNNQVKINAFRVYVNGTETNNYISIDPNQNVRFEADVIAYDGQLTTSNVVLKYGTNTAGSAQLDDTVYSSTPVTGFVKNTYTYSWDNADFDYANFVNDPAGWQVIPFVVEARSDFDFVATPYNQDVVALNIPDFTFNGISPTRYSGTDPEGWFAPEHDVKLTMVVISPLDNINPRAEFDNITNNFPDVQWINGTVNTTSHEPIPGLTIYTHAVDWVQIPDVQACWNTYSDGETIQIEIQYDDFFISTPISAFRDIKVDLEVPTYERYSIVQAASTIADFATANTITGINTFANHIGAHNFNLSLNNPLDLNSYEFDGSLFVKRVVEDMNGVSVEEAGVTAPTISGNWTVEQLGSEVVSPHEIALIWKFTPVDPTLVANTDIVEIQFNQLEDLVGHLNYAGVYNSPSSRYAEVGPIATVVFIASQADVDGITAFQYDGIDRMNSETSPYISNGGRIGLILEVPPHIDDNATVTSVEILADNYNLATNDWVSLVDNGNNQYFLNSDIFVNETTLGWLPLEYRITYSTTEYSQKSVSNVYNLIDVTSTNLVSISVWSETLGESAMYYVTPGDNATIKVVFDSNAPEIGTVLKPFVTLTDFSNILDMADPYVVPQADINWNGTNWVAEVTGILVKDSHSLTSQEVSVTATNITGQETLASSKIVSYAGSGPIVPLIKHVELITDNAVNFLAVSGTQVVNPVVNVYINTLYQEFINDVTIDPVAGLAFGPYTVAPTTAHGSKWLVTFPVTITNPALFTEGDIVTLDITSIRNPFEYVATVFEHHESLDVEVDGNDFAIVINNPGIQNPILGDFEFSIDFSDFGETYDPAFVPALADFVISSPQLVNDLNPTVLNGNVVSLTIDASDFTADAETLGNTDITVTYTNIYGFEKSEFTNILLDATAPVVIANGITFNSVVGPTTYAWGSVIGYDEDWTSLTVELEDPAMFGTAGVGIVNADISIALGTVTPSTVAFTNLVASFAGNVVEYHFNGGYSGFDLAEGNYILTVNAVDGLGNAYSDTQEFIYAHSPSGVTALTDPAVTLNSGNDIELEFLVNDPTGVVNTVEFQVYLDSNNDGDYVDDMGNLVLQATDSVYPYGFNWDLSSSLYTSYQYNANYDLNSNGDNLDADENIRNYVVRVLTTSSQMRSVSDTYFTYSVADVTAPEVSDVFAAGLNPNQVIYDYITPANNNIDFTALVGTWTDVDYVELTVNGDLLTYDLITPVNWIYDATDIGEVVITAQAFDFVGNVSAAADFSTVLEIVNPSYDKFYNLTLIDYDNYDTDNSITNGTVYSPNNPLITNNVRLYAEYPNGLAGISEIQFFVNRIETATGIGSNLPVNNDAGVNPQYGNSNVVLPINCWDETAGKWNSWITVDSAIYTNNGNYDDTDYTYEFYAVLIDSYTSIEVIQSGVTNSDADFRVDYLIPELTVNAASVTHTSYTYYNPTNDRLVFDFVDFDGLTNSDFVVDYNGVNVADNANITIDALTNTVSIPWTGLDEIEGEGVIVYNVVVTDTHGNSNILTPTPINVFVDNQAPQTAIANVKYVTDADNGGDAMNSFHVFSGDPILDPIAVIAGATENLSIQIDRAQILELSSENTDTWANRTQPWYSNTNDDIYPPVNLYRNIDGAGWALVAYDHEVDANNMYQFDITVDTGNVVEFAVIAEDTRGNIEGDVVVRDPITNNVLRPLNGALELDELNNAINLTVNVLYPIDITTTIVNHNADDVINGLALLTANVATPANIISVEFQYLADGTWTAIGTDDSMVDVDYEFNIDLDQIPYSVVPGVHVEIIDSSNFVTIEELDRVGDNWSNIFTLLRDSYTVNYYVDANNDGVIDGNEIANYFIQTETINADGYAYQFDTTTIVDGSYLFRAVPFDGLDATDDIAAAVPMNLIIDNTAPSYDITALNFVTIDSYDILDENVEFTLAYANVNDVYQVRAWLVNIANPVDNYRIVFERYAAYDVRTTDFSVNLTTLATPVPDGNYYLKLNVEDFNNNANIQTPAIGADLHVDTNAPVITAVNNNLNMTGIYTETHQFEVSYNDYLAQLLDVNNDALGVKEIEATFTHNAIVDVVDVKVSDDGALVIFDWAPSQAMMDEVINGHDDILVNVDVIVTDHNDYVSNIFNAGNFTLGSSEVGAKIMVVSDFRNGVETYHQTSVTDNNEIHDVIGGNNLNLYAFLPEGNNVTVPNNVSFEYWDGINWVQYAANATWNPIANFTGTGTISGYAKYMEVTWNIANLDGDYTVRTVSEYGFGDIINETNLHIWNSTIVPEIVVSTIDGTVTTEVNRGTEYIVSLGNIVSTHPEFLNQVNYMYRFLDVNNNVASPWNQLSGFTADDYDWTIGMDYLFAEKVQLAVQVENIFNNIADQVSFIANGGTPYVVDIVDSEAPMITDLTVTQAGNPVVIDSWVAITNALDIAVTVDNAVLDLSSVVIDLDGAEVYSVAYDTNNQVNPTPVNYTLDISALTTGTYQISVITTDFVGHTYTEVFGFSVDTDVPTSALVLVENDNGYIERNVAYTFNANAMDNVTAAEDLMINYSWSDAGVDVWTPIALDIDNQWTIPANWLMNNSYDFKAEVEDEYANVSESIVTYQVRDNVTTIAINSINANPAFNGVHFNGDVEIELAVGADVTEINSWIKAPGATAWDAPVVLPVDLATGIATYVFSPTATDIDGIYTFGFGPVVRFNEIQVEIEVIIDREVSVTNPVIAGMTDDSIFNMNDEFVLTLEVAADEVLDTNIELQYADVLNNTWMSLGTTPAVLTAGVAEVTFSNLGLASGFYNFKAIVSDFAVLANELEIDLASMVYFDATAPEVFFTNIDNTTEYVLGNNVSINADVNYTDGTNNIAPLDVASVEFLVNGISHTVVETAPYTFVWNTALLANVGTYTIEAIVTDNDNFTNNVLQNVVVVTSDENDPYAVITGFEFNNETISSDKMYAKVTNWGNNITSVVAQYTEDNIEWIEFAINTTNNDPLYDFDFNAEAIQNAIAVKVLVKMNNNEETSLVYPLDVTYNAGVFDLVDANGNIEIHENNLTIVDTDSRPNVIRINENGFAGYEAINNNFELNLVVNANNELPGYWLSGVANNAAWITFVELDTQIGIATNNGVTVNYNSPYWFVMLDNERLLADHYAQLTDQVLVRSNINGNAVYTMPVTGTVAAEGNIVALAWDAVLADFVELDVTYNETDATMTFTAPVNTVVTVGQYVGFEMFLTEFAPVNDDVYEDATTLWTLPNVEMNFTVYHEETAQGYQLPAGFGLGNISITLNDGVNNVNNIALTNGVVSFDLVNMNAGVNELMVNVEINGFNTNQALTFSVDNTIPTIVVEQTATLSAAERTLSATMEDAETGLVDYNLVITNNAPTVTTVISVPMNEITVAGNVYSYELSVEELVTLVPQPMRLSRNDRAVASLNVQWTAVNNLNQINALNANITANVVVNRPIITIDNSGFDNGWWLNPAMSNEILMTVVPAPGRTVALEDINVSILAITDGNPAGVVIQQSNPVPTANTNEYMFGFAQLQLPNSLGLLIRVNAIDDIDVNNVAEQTFSLDYMDPIVTATAPTNLVVNYGTNAQIAFSFRDPQGQFTEVVNGVIIPHYSGASGIDISTLVVALDGAVINGDINNNSFVYAASDLAPGTHTAVASISDFVGNTASAAVSFEVVGGPAPVVDFSPLANDTWWITTSQNYEFELEVDSGHADTEIQSVVANIIELPSNEVIQGPFSVTIVNGQGTINFHGGIVSPNQNAIKVEVVAVNDWAVQTTSSQTYPIDNGRPELTIVNPVDNFSTTIGNSVNVSITTIDSLSGMLSSSIKVTSLNSDFSAEAIDNDTPDSFNFVVTPDMVGTYVIEAQAIDMAGNVTTVTRNFDITAPAPIIIISNLADSNGWVNAQNNNIITFTVDGNGSELDNSSIMASFIAIPSNDIIVEPYTVTDDNGYEVEIHGGVIPADATAIKLVVQATNVGGVTGQSNRNFPIDNSKPEITIVNPVVEFSTLVGNSVNVSIMATDTMSGLLSSSIKVTSLNSDFSAEAIDTDTPETLSLAVTPARAGTYVIEAQAKDMSGNITTVTRNFEITAPAPIISISNLGGSNGWVNTQNINNIVFTVDGNGSDLDNTSIMASVIAVPSNAVIYEPYTVQSTNGEYIVGIHGGVIPADASAIKVIVTASNVVGGSAVANHSYPIDSYSPTVEFVSPVANTAYTLAENMFVEVMMELSDVMPTVKSVATSGLDKLEIKVYNSASQTVVDTTKTNVANIYVCRVPVNGLGQYRIEATIYDKAGNRTTKMMNFNVDVDYSAMNLEFTAKPYMYPSPLQRGDVGTFVIPTTKEAQVTIEIFDFAGKLAREISHNSIGGNTNNMIQFDGRTNDGKKLARGAYFARIRVVDGVQELNKVVKIAIQ